MFKTLKDKYDAYREKKMWEKQHLIYLRNLINEDARWLATDPKASLLIQRYTELLEDEWYKVQVDDIVGFRQRYRELPSEKYEYAVPLHILKDIQELCSAEYLSGCNTSDMKLKEDAMYAHYVLISKLKEWMCK